MLLLSLQGVIRDDTLTNFQSFKYIFGGRWLLLLRKTECLYQFRKNHTIFILVWNICRLSLGFHPIDRGFFVLGAFKALSTAPHPRTLIPVNSFQYESYNQHICSVANLEATFVTVAAGVTRPNSPLDPYLLPL